MLWLPRDDIEALSSLKPAQYVRYYFSGELAGGERAPWPASWKPVVRMTYTFEMPDKRGLYNRNFHSWMNMRKLAIVDEPLQAQVYSSMRILTDTVSEMLDNLYRDYMLERLENMLSKSESQKATQQTREVNALGVSEELARRYPHARPLTETVNLPPGSVAGGGMPGQSLSIYPRLSLGVGQRFASKGAYIVRMEGDQLVAESAWLTPQ